MKNRDKKGFTLIEIIVGLMLVSLTAIAATVMIRTAMVVFYKNEDLGNAKLAAQRAMEYISDALYAADAVTISPPQDHSGKNSLRAADGNLYIDDENWFKGALLPSQRTEITIAGDNTTIRLKLEILGGDGQGVYSCEKAITLGNMQLQEDKNILWQVPQNSTGWQLVYHIPEEYKAE